MTKYKLTAVSYTHLEGNGRSQREFIRSLALKNGYLIYFDRVSEEEMLLASQKSVSYTHLDVYKRQPKKRSQNRHVFHLLLLLSFLFGTTKRRLFANSPKASSPSSSGLSLNVMAKA